MADAQRNRLFRKKGYRKLLTEKISLNLDYIPLRDLSSMVKEINRSEVSPQDKLSDEVQFYDASQGILENAKNREQRLSSGQAEEE